MSGVRSDRSDLRELIGGVVFTQEMIPHILQSPCRVFIEQPDRTRCEHCNAVACLEVRVWDKGSYTQQTHRHAVNCKQIVCPHNLRWSSDCEECSVDMRTTDDD